MGNAIAEREAPEPVGEALERLADDEVALERGVAEARDAAAAVVEGARREAELIASETRLDAEREAERLRAHAAEQLDRALANGRAGALADAAEVRRRAGVNRERAIARALAAILPGT